MIYLYLAPITFLLKPLANTLYMYMRTADIGLRPNLIIKKMLCSVLMVDTLLEVKVQSGTL